LSGRPEATTKQMARCRSRDPPSDNEADDPLPFARNV
jgi:hypothetical protein